MYPLLVLALPLGFLFSFSAFSVDNQQVISLKVKDVLTRRGDVISRRFILHVIKSNFITKYYDFYIMKLITMLSDALQRCNERKMRVAKGGREVREMRNVLRS